MNNFNVVIFNEKEKKRAFAVALTKNPANAFLAALAVEPDTGKALFISQAWVGDPEVLAYQAEVVEEFGDDLDLPNKTELLRKIIARADNCPLDEEAHKYYKLYADIRGYIEKPQNNVNNNIVSVNKVMIVKDHGTNEDWRKKAAEQQRALINASTKRIN